MAIQRGQRPDRTICVPAEVSRPQLIDGSSGKPSRTEHKIGIRAFSEIRGDQTIPTPAAFIAVRAQAIRACVQVQYVNRASWITIPGTCATKEELRPPLHTRLPNYTHPSLCVPGTRNYRTKAIEAVLGYADKTPHPTATAVGS